MKFTHIDNNKHPNMVDVSEKVSGERSAVAECIVCLLYTSDAADDL